MTAITLLGVVAFTAFVWWFATGVVLCLGRRPEGWHGTVMLCLSVPAALAVGLAWALRDEATVGGALAGYLAAVTLWAWHEAAFLLGYSAGPNREACPPSAGDGTRFRLAWRAMRDHELGLAATVVALGLALHGAPNEVAFHAFAALWLARIAAKLCIFEGVPAMAVEMMPARLSYLTSYFGRRPPGVTFGIAVGLLAGATAWAGRGAATAVDPHTAAAQTLLATTLGLALLEHLFLVLPVRDGRLWAWAMGFSGEGAAHPANDNDEREAASPPCGRRLHGVALRSRAVAARSGRP